MPLCDTAFGKGWLLRRKLGVLDFLVGLKCREENRSFSGQQHQAQFGLNPALYKYLWQFSGYPAKSMQSGLVIWPITRYRF